MPHEIPVTEEEIAAVVTEEAWGESLYGPADQPLMTEEQMLSLLLLCGPGKDPNEPLSGYIVRVDTAYARLFGNGQRTSRKQWDRWRKWCEQLQEAHGDAT